MISKKVEIKPVGKNANNKSEIENERKLNTGMKSYEIIDKHILVRGAFLRKGELGKPPITYSFLRPYIQERRIIS